MADGKQKVSEILQSQIKAFQAEDLEERYERYKEKIRTYHLCKHKETGRYRIRKINA